MKKHVTAQEMAGSICMLLWIFAVNIATLFLFPTMQAWPMFFVTIFFFVMGAEVKNIFSILASGLTGIVFAWLLIKALPLLAPIMGEVGATVLLLFAVLAVIFVGGNFLPVIFNNIAFAYLTVAAIDLTIIEQRTGGWIAMLLIGGSVIVVGAMAVGGLVGKAFSSKAPAAQETDIA